MYTFEQTRVTLVSFSLKKQKEKGSKIINFSVPAWYLHRALDPSSGNEGRVMD